MRVATLIFFVLVMCSNILAGELSMLKNGVQFITEKRDYTRTLSVTVMIKGGMFRENPQNNGIGELFSTVWLKSNKILDNMEYYGGHIDTGISYDYGEVNISVVTDFADKVLGDIDAFFNNPQFDPNVFDVEKMIQLNKIKNMRDNANTVAAIGFNKATYDGFVYSMETAGTSQSVSSLTLAHLQDYYREIMNGKDFVVSVAGNYDNRTLERLKEIFEKIPNQKERFQINCEASSIKTDGFVEEEYDRIKQAKLFVGYTAPSANNNDYLVIKLLSDILGGGMSSKYFNILRKDKGYAYAVGSYYPSRICSSRFVGYIGLQYTNVKDAIATIDGMNKRIKDYVTEDDIKYTKNYTLGKILSEAQTNNKVAWYNAFFTTLGLGSDYFDRYIEGIKGITMDDLIRVSDIFYKPKTIYILKPKSDK